jgi:hypothetical protein
MTEVLQATETEAPARRRPLAPIGRLLRSGPPVVHPFLMAAFPIVFLFAQNLHEAITPHDMLTPLKMSLGVTAVLMVLGWAIFRNAKAVGLVISVWLFLFFSYGRMSNGLEGKTLGHARYLLTLWAMLAVAAGVAAFMLRSRLAAATNALNLITAVLVVMNVVPIGLYRPPVTSKTSTAPLSGELAAALAAAKSNKHLTPDIYYIMPEDFGDERTLRERYGIETHFLVQYLRKEGFYVAEDSMANYQNTHMSLSASGNLQYLPAFLGKAATSDDAVRTTIRGFAASRFLQALEYRYVHLGHWWTPTATDPTADIDVKSGSLTEFSSILYDTTMLPTLSKKLHVQQEILDPRRARYQEALQELDDVVHTAKLHGPKFVFAHLGLPHAPYVFNRNGDFVPGAKQREVDKFADQAFFTAKKLQELIGRLLEATGRKAVIILQTDEGPDPRGKARQDIARGRFEHSDLRPELLAKYRILNAYFLPGVGTRELYPTITPVNSFRLVFDLYFRTKLGLLPDVIWGEKKRPGPAEFVDITDMLQEK